MNLCQQTQVLRSFMTHGHLRMLKHRTSQAQFVIQSSKQSSLRNCSQSNTQQNITGKSPSISSLVDKIKKVQRVGTTKVNSIIRQNITETLIDKIDTLKSQELIKDKLYVRQGQENFSVSGKYQSEVSENNLNNQTDNKKIKYVQQSKFQKLLQQNCFLRHSLNKLLVSQQKLTDKLKNLYEVLKSKNQLISYLKQQINKQQNNLSSQKQSLFSQFTSTNDNMLKVQMTKNNSALNLQRQVFEVIVLPIENNSQRQLANQINQLKLSKLQMERDLMIIMNHKIRQKNLEYEAMRQDFSRKLNHYKQLLYKFTTRPANQQKTISDNSHKNIIIQTISGNKE